MENIYAYNNHIVYYQINFIFLEINISCIQNFSYSYKVIK